MNAKEMAFDDFDAAMVYSPDTGKVTNKMHRSSRAVKGGPVGVLRWDDDGYLRAKLNKKEYLVHRIAYLLHHGVINKKLSQSHSLGNHAEQHKMKHHRRDHPKRDAVDSFKRELHIIHKLHPVHAGMAQNLHGHIWAKERITHENQNNDRQHNPDCPTRDLKHCQN